MSGRRVQSTVLSSTHTAHLSTVFNVMCKRRVLRISSDGPAAPRYAVEAIGRTEGECA